VPNPEQSGAGTISSFAGEPILPAAKQVRLAWSPRERQPPATRSQTPGQAWIALIQQGVIDGATVPAPRPEASGLHWHGVRLVELGALKLQLALTPGGRRRVLVPDAALAAAGTEPPIQRHCQRWTIGTAQLTRTDPSQPRGTIKGVISNTVVNQPRKSVAKNRCVACEHSRQNSDVESFIERKTNANTDANTNERLPRRTSQSLGWVQRR
jgi:hypothetical protein